MKIAATLAALSAVTLIWAAPAQDPLNPVPEPLAPVPSADDFDVAHWAAALRNTDLALRQKAYDRVLAEAGRREAVYEVVTAWALDTSNVELAWTAQLMLRELDTDPLRFRRTLRIPGLRTSPFGGWGHGDLFEELESLLERHRTNPFDDLPRVFDLDDLDWQGSLRAGGLSIERGPDGVKVNVREMVDGNEETKTYEAESMEALLEAHPELKERLGVRIESGRSPFGSDPWRLFRDPFDDFGTEPHELFDDPGRGGLQPLRPIEPRTDVLGVHILSPEDRRQPVEGVRSDLGLEVLEVLPGTLAEFLGIEVGDIVVSINGEEIASPEDVKRVLAKREKNGAVEVDVVDRDEKNRTRTWKPASEEKESRGF